MDETGAHDTWAPPVLQGSKAGPATANFAAHAGFDGEVGQVCPSGDFARPPDPVAGSSSRSRPADALAGRSCSGECPAINPPSEPSARMASKRLHVNPRARASLFDFEN